MRRVLVTRPEPGASATAQALRCAGWEPVLLPLSEIRPLPVDRDDALPPIQAVAATSANALRHAPAHLLAQHLSMPLFAVGAATEQAARDAGFATIVTGSGDAAGLAAAITGRLAAGSTVLYLCGRIRRPEVEQLLRDAGITALPVETYDAAGCQIADGELDRLGALSAVLVHSAAAARALAALATRHALASCLAQARLIAMSGRAAEPVAALFTGRTTVAGEPTDAAMIVALGRPD